VGFVVDKVALGQVFSEPFTNISGASNHKIEEETSKRRYKLIIIVLASVKVTVQ
jgi:hypothetical protein